MTELLILNDLCFINFYLKVKKEKPICISSLSVSLGLGFKHIIWKLILSILVVDGEDLYSKLLVLTFIYFHLSKGLVAVETDLIYIVVQVFQNKIYF